MKRKLIEVALPLEAINRESAREKSIRQGHPSTLHLWWARRPLAACRAVLFAQLVDDPSAHPDRFPTEEDQALERRRLFDILERLVVWENAGDERLLHEAHAEIASCFDGKPPAVLDPFAGGGSIPLEAQRLGLEAQASDLNPVAVLINKALLEIPPVWRGQPPVFPDAAGGRPGQWPRALGLAEDVRRYGGWMRDEAERRIGHLYPKATLPDGTKATVIAWIWARTVTCPNPACGTSTPLMRSFWLSKRRDRPTWLRPVVATGRIEFEVVEGAGPGVDGTVGRTGAVCLLCSAPVPLAYIRAEGQAHRMATQLVAVVAEGSRRRVYLAPDEDQLAAAAAATCPGTAAPDGELFDWPGRINVVRYGLTEFKHLFTPRQLLSLATYGDLLGELQERVDREAADSGRDKAADYGRAVITYLAFAVSGLANLNSTGASWRAVSEAGRTTFARQALPMVWDFVEVNPVQDKWIGAVERVAGVLEQLVASDAPVEVTQADAVSRGNAAGAVICTDPPYYDNICYSDLADYFYVWLRRVLRQAYPELLSTLLTPKREELVANPYRLGGKKAAEAFFEQGFVDAFATLTDGHPDVPLTLFYAFKQAEQGEAGRASTGWETMLAGLVSSGLQITATWPMRTEGSARINTSGANALASSVVLACRPRGSVAEAVSRRAFVQALEAELPHALRQMQQGALAPVDLAQAAIGPGMAVFTRYRAVVEADGSQMEVRTALALINQALDEALTEQEGDFSAETRFCLKWFSQFGWDEQPYGVAESLSKAVATAVDALVRGGAFWARAGRARLVGPDELSEGWDPLSADRVTEWEAVVRLAQSLDRDGVDDAARLMALAGQRVDLDATQELAYLLYSVCERKGWTASAALFNGLGTSWSDLSAAARSPGSTEHGRASSTPATTRSPDGRQQPRLSR